MTLIAVYSAAFVLWGLVIATHVISLLPAVQP